MHKMSPLLCCLLSTAVAGSCFADGSHRREDGPVSLPGTVLSAYHGDRVIDLTSQDPQNALRALQEQGGTYDINLADGTCIKGVVGRPVLPRDVEEAQSSSRTSLVSSLESSMSDEEAEGALSPSLTPLVSEEMSLGEPHRSFFQTVRARASKVVSTASHGAQTLRRKVREALDSEAWATTKSVSKQGGNVFMHGACLTGSLIADVGVEWGKGLINLARNTKDAFVHSKVGLPMFMQGQDWVQPAVSFTPLAEDASFGDKLERGSQRTLVGMGLSVINVGVLAVDAVHGLGKGGWQMVKNMHSAFTCNLWAMPKILHRWF